VEFTLQAFGPFLHWLTLVVLCVIPVAAAYLIYRLGRLPGAIARARKHPQATAIKVCGWMGIVTLILWPLALVWAYTAPGKPLTGGPSQQALTDRLREARQRLAALEGRLR
jgi:hypothetical protein